MRSSGCSSRYGSRSFWNVHGAKTGSMQCGYARCSIFHFAKWNIEHRAYPHCIEPVFAPCTFQKLRLPYLDEHPDDLMPLLFQERRRDGAIHAARESYKNISRHSCTVLQVTKPFTLHIRKPCRLSP